ncbi:hypothetical protein MASR2M78_06550 [Treponema sp.]
MFSMSTLLLGLTIFIARVVDVSLGTFRHAMIIRGKRFHALGLAFVESLIWVFAVSKVLTEIQEPFTALAFASGFAVGTFVGISIEDMFKIGEQSVRIFTTLGTEIASCLRDDGFRATSLDGQGRDGKVNLIYVQVKRREVEKVCAHSRKIDPLCYIVIDDIRTVSYGGVSSVRK